jgi:uncharacterized membrane protein
MNITRPVALAGLLTAGAAAIGAWACVTLPAAARIAINYHGPGEAPDGAVPKTVGLAIIPVVSAIVTVSLALAPYRARMIKGFEASSGAYGLLITSLAALFLVTEGALVAQAMSPSFDVLRWVFLACAVLLILVGNTLGKVRHNDIFGVRTPWTLADARVWDKTHRFTGRLMVLGAVALAAVAGFLPDHRLPVATLVLAAAGPMIGGAVYSYLIGRRPAPV